MSCGAGDSVMGCLPILIQLCICRPRRCESVVATSSVYAVGAESRT
jgi:hypothetical protein